MTALTGMNAGLVGVLCAAALACTLPPRVPPRPPDPPQIFTTTCDGLHMRLTVERTPRSVSTYDLYITDASGQPLPEEARVVVAFTSTRPPVSTTTLVAQRTGAGRYGPPHGFLLAPGTWQVEVIARQASGAEAVCWFDFAV
ncbi:MAG: hypothetical protein NZ578_11820 [Candidatus Binatia bacterium]|nr:hypothetical protein [Candidatus Binatia bacterium]